MGCFDSLIAKIKSASPGTKKQDKNPADETHKNAPAPAEQNDMAEKPVGTAATPQTLTIALQNKSNDSNVYAYVTGLAIDNGNRYSFLQADGRTLYTPASPSQTGAPLAADVAIPLGGPGSTKNVTIPRLAGGRIWFSFGAKLTFKLNPGPGIVEPSVTNSSDPNININWNFTEFTFNDFQLFVNLSYVDFISQIPLAISITNTAGEVKSSPGMAANGFSTVVSELRAQASRDGRPWDRLIYSANGNPLRALSPNNLFVSDGNAWGDYWDPYVNQVWSKFQSQDLTVNTQAGAGNLTGRVSNNVLSLGSAGTFSKPNAKDIFSCSTGPFQTGDNAARNAVIPRLAAAFNRSVLLDTNIIPNGSSPANYYKNPITNHYARIVHQVQKDGRGYAFPYDDVVPDGGSDVAGVLFDSNPTLWTVAVGGN